METLNSKNSWKGKMAKTLIGYRATVSNRFSTRSKGFRIARNLFRTGSTAGMRFVQEGMTLSQ